MSVKPINSFRSGSARCAIGLRRVRKTGFSLVEILVAVSLLSVIILGLMAMFGQTQRAFRLGMSQTDVLESGRLVTEMITRELEQTTPDYSRYGTTPGFYAELVNSSNISTQVLPGTAVLRTNRMADIFFVTRENQTWTGHGYFIRTDAKVANSFGPVGTLYRYETNNSTFQFDQNPSGLWVGFNNARNGNLFNVSKLLEGVVEFQVRAFDTNGIAITPLANQVFTNISGGIITNAYWSLGDPTEVGYVFTSNAVPAFVELEIGILEQQIYERYQSIPVAAAREEYLRKQAGHVHLFRQRIPIRNVDTSAYQ